LLHEACGSSDTPDAQYGLRETHGRRLRDPDHLVQHLDGYGSFALLSGQAAGAELWTGDRL
jgi:hypothetical protein